MDPRIREDNGRGSRGAGGSEPPRTRGLGTQHITDDHKGRPYGGRMAGWGRGMGPRIREDNWRGRVGRGGR